ncbi:sulfite exporter TauE/SafE family protein [Arthrobacter sp. zg-Y40]|uniref:sulfite exporter TauE/SafE family protein n=1 Tax=Arthrobacter sp. zg-Y40 TaxID=2886939 RepID=UPI001D15A696|nr:sulfite exporter TauE/SafE family protein [Arthrobacter sp. zg-Y40]MCC3279851.1 sulfite exporter TauE/SafE family protein [Arthrobacter sp. zg-Y40]
MFVLGAAVAVVVGTVVGLVGAGGAIIAVPALVYLVGLPPDDAVPTSLIVVGLSSLAGLLPRLHTGINWTLVAVLGIAGFPASWAGAALSERLDPDVLMLLFAALMVVAGTRMLLAGRRIPGALPAAVPVRGPLLRGVAVGLAVGFLTGLLGVGGGFLLIPALAMFLGVPLQQAVGTSLAVIAINSASGFSAHLAGLGMDWTLTLAFAAVAVAASLAAARLSRLLDDRVVSRIFAVLVLLVAAWVTVQSLPAVVGQAAPPEDAAPPTPTAPAPSTPAAGLTAELAASRLYAGEDSVQLRITNLRKEPVAISAASIGTGLYAAPQPWQPARSEPVRLAPGATVSLPVPLATPVCAGAESEGTESDGTESDGTESDGTDQEGADQQGLHTATLELDSGTVQLDAADPRGDFATMHQRDCLVAGMDAVARISIAPELAVDGSTAVARVLVEPSGNSASLVLHRFEETPLLAAGGSWPQETTIRGTDSPRELSLVLAPQRCDAHALAEDKVGTLLPVYISAGAYEGQVRLAAPAEFTANVYAFVQGACAAR